MRHVKIFSVLSALVITLPLAAQQTDRIDFHEYASDTTTSYQAAVGRPVSSHGLDFYQASGFNPAPGPAANNVLSTWGTQDAGVLNRPVNLGSSTALWGPSLGAEIDIFRTGSDVVFGTHLDPFSLFSMDVSHLYSTAYSPFTLTPITLTFAAFTGQYADNPVVFFQTFTIPVPPAVNGFWTPLLQTLVFDDRFQNVSNVFFNQGTGSGRAFQFTNVVASTPEPSEMVLLGTGLTGLVGITGRLRSRKRSTNV